MADNETGWKHLLGSKSNSEEKRKNVLVVHTDNTSSYLEEQHLSDRMCTIYSSEEFGEHELRKLRSKDNIQFHRFADANIGSDPNYKESIAPHIDKLEAYLKGRGEKLDAIVLPFSDPSENESTIRWLADMKERFPDTKILVDYFLPITVKAPDNLQGEEKKNYLTEEATKKFCVTELTGGEICSRDEWPITHSSSNYKLSAPIDCYCPISRSHRSKADSLRELIGMPPYKEAEQEKCGARCRCS